jgi:hypothetical protein
MNIKINKIVAIIAIVMSTSCGSKVNGPELKACYKECTDDYNACNALIGNDVNSRQSCQYVLDTCKEYCFEAEYRL